MNKMVEDMLRPIVRSFIEERTQSLVMRTARWIDAHITGPYTKVVIGMLLGLAAFFAIPIATGLFGL